MSSCWGAVTANNPLTSNSCRFSCWPECARRRGTSAAVHGVPRFLRFPQAEHDILMRQFLQEKYAATHIDVLISTSRDALDFVLQHRNALFPNVPYIFAFVTPYEVPDLHLPNGVVGILERYDFAKTLEMAHRLQPQARRVVVVSAQPRTTRCSRALPSGSCGSMALDSRSLFVGTAPRSDSRGGRAPPQGHDRPVPDRVPRWRR